jgi:asparagine synthase (glutamine-hydrolysing)
LSGLAGLFNLDGTPVERSALAEMADVIAARGPDNRAFVVDSQLGLAQSLLATTPQESTSQALVNIAGQYHIAADASLYNREELLGKLAPAASTELACSCDRELILNAYLRWGVSCLKHLVGDFAFAIWDAPRSQLFLARDPVGIRQLYYTRHGRRLLFANDIKAILRVLPQQPPPNQTLLKQVLALNPQAWITQTAYTGIAKLPPGHHLLAGRKVRVARYYGVEGMPAVQDRSDRDCIEQFREAFTAAVSSRLRSSTTAGLVVSGGVDSSSVTAITAATLGTSGQNRQVPMLHSYAGQDCSDCDDWPYLQQLLALYPNWNSTLIDGDALWALKQTAADQGYTASEPEIDLTTRGWMDVAHAAGRAGNRVLLTGHGGDEVMLGDAYHDTGLLGHLPVSDQRREWQHFKAARRSSSLRLLLSGIIKPAATASMPPVVREHLRAWKQQNAIPRWLCADSQARSDAEAGVESGNEPVFGKTFGDRPTLLQGTGYRLALDGPHQRAFSSIDQAAGHHQVEFRYPFYDTRLIELLASFPLRMFFRNGATKWVLREITRGLLPDSLRNRTSFCTNHQWIEKGWRLHEKPLIKQLIRNSYAVDCQLADGAGLAAAWERFWRGDDAEIWYLSAWINVESWLRSQYPHSS